MAANGAAQLWMGRPIKDLDRVHEIAIAPPLRRLSWGYGVEATCGLLPGPFFLKEQGDREAVELSVRALRHNLVHNPNIRVGPEPPGHVLTKILTFTRLRSRKDLHAVERHLPLSLQASRTVPSRLFLFITGRGAGMKKFCTHTRFF